MTNLWLERLKKVMDERDLSAKPLSVAAGLNETYIRDLFKKGTEPTIGKLSKIAEALDLPLSYFTDEKLDVSPELEVHIINWVSAGKLTRVPDSDDIIGTIRVGALDPKGDWMALKVEGDSMDRISPPGSVILVNRKDKRLVPNGCYIIADGDEAVTYKRWRSSPDRFEPVSTNPAHEPLFYDQEPTIIGRVKKTILDM